MEGDTFASKRRRLLDALQSERMQSEPIPAMPAFNATVPAGLSPIVRGYGAQPPVMGMGMQNPRVSMGGPQPSMGFGQLPIPQMGSVLNAPDVPAPNAANASLQRPPMPPQRPQSFAPPPMPPQRPEGLGQAATGQEMMPGAMGQVQGFNPLAAMGNAQAYADQFAGGDLAKIAARAYRNDDGTMWNDYYVR